MNSRFTILLFAQLGLLSVSIAGADPDGRQIAENVFNRDDGSHVSQSLTMILTDRIGVVRRRQARLYRAEGERVQRSAIVITAPATLQGTGFITFDYQGENREDDRWLYLPSLRRQRRISAADRGAYFLGTDFSYEDIKERTRLSLDDYDFRRLDRPADEHRVWIEARPRSSRIAQELGYSRIEAIVDTTHWMYRHLVYWDIAGNRLKEIELDDLEVVDGVLTARTIRCRNTKTGHSTTFLFADIDYSTPIPDSMFTTAALRRGAL